MSNFVDSERGDVDDVDTEIHSPNDIEE